MADQQLQEKNTLYAPAFSNDWNEQPLYPLADWLNGMAFKNFEFAPKGKPVIKIAEIKNGISGQTKFTNEKYDEKYLLKKGDMLFCWSGQPQTSIDVFWWDGPEGWLNQHIFKVTSKLENKYFFFYLLKYLKPNFVQIAINKQTTGLGHVTKGDLERFVVKLPEPEEQRAIAAVLSALDDKIELLREQNKTLEATAQAIFKEWFVNFNFPGATGKMIDSELGKIPEGWRVGKFSDIAKIDWGNTSLTNGSYVRDGQYLGVSAAGCDGRMDHKEYNFGAVVISAIGEYCGKLFFPTEDFTAIKNTLVVEELNARASYFVYFGLQIWKLERRGAAQPFLSKGDTEKIEMIIPDTEILNKFRNIADSLFKKIRNNGAQVEDLSNLRDTLLPKLMKGEIGVKRFNN